MRRVTRPVLTGISTIGLLAMMSSPTIAQSGTRGNPPSGSSNRAMPPAGSGQRGNARDPVALEGYCPVSLQMMHKWAKGNPSIQSVLDGRTYYFANEQGKQMFAENPVKFAPVLGGDCVVSLVKMGQRVSGSIHHASLRDGRLFLFANQDGKKMFEADPRTYVNADLAYGGNCVVCNVNLRQSVPGKTDFTVVHQGLRYLFPSADQRDEFLANPGKYEVATISGGGTATGSASRQATSGFGSGGR